MTALPCSGGTGNGLLHFDGATDWADALDGVADAVPDAAGDVPGRPGRPSRWARRGRARPRAGPAR